MLEMTIIFATKIDPRDKIWKNELEKLGVNGKKSMFLKVIHKKFDIIKLYSIEK